MAVRSLDLGNSGRVIVTVYLRLSPKPSPVRAHQGLLGESLS